MPVLNSYMRLLNTTLRQFNYLTRTVDGTPVHIGCSVVSVQRTDSRIAFSEVCAKKRTPKGSLLHFSRRASRSKRSISIFPMTHS